MTEFPNHEATQAALDAAGYGYLRLGADLGAGGMGSVLAAEHQEHGPCAIKFLDPNLNQTFHLTRFKREFRAAKRMRHPNIVRVFEMGQTSIGWFFTMEQLAGGPVHHHFSEPASNADIVTIGTQILAALDHLHGRSIVHRDLKPSNILLTDSSNDICCKLTDMGIAKVADFSESSEQSGLLGTARYVSPEYIREGHVDPRLDLYAAGIILYELAAGHHPLTGADYQAPVNWLALHLHREPARLDNLRGDIAPAVVATIHGLLSKHPDHRPKTAAMALSELRGGAPLPAYLPKLGGEPYLAFPRFVGRDAELNTCKAALDAALTAGSAQKVRTLFVTGASGSGKSRFVEQCLRHAAATHEGTVLLGQCRETGGATSAVLSLATGLRHLGAQAAPPTDDTQDSGSTRNIMATGVITGSSSGNSGVSEDDIGLQARELAQEGFLQSTADSLVDGAQMGPVVVVLEDVQWADVSTLEFISHLIHAVDAANARGKATPVAFVLAHRPARDSAHLDETRRDLAQRGLSLNIELSRLQQESVYGLVATRLMTDPNTPELRAFVDHYFNPQITTPLYVNQGLELLMARGVLAAKSNTSDGGWDLVGAIGHAMKLPESIVGTIGERASRMSVHTQEFLTQATVFGRRFEVPILAASFPRQHAAILDCLDEALSAGFLVERETVDTYDFVHDKQHEALYHKLDNDERASLHRAAAAGITGRSRWAKRYPAELAHHFGVAGDHEQAVKYGIIAGTREYRNHAYLRAVESYARAIEHAQTADIRVANKILRRYADACLIAGRYDDADAAYTRLLDTTKGAKRQALLNSYAHLQYRRGDLSVATTSFEQVLTAYNCSIPRSRLGLYAGVVTSAVRFITGLILRPRIANANDNERLGESVQLQVCAAMNRLAETSYYDDPVRSMYYNFRTSVLARQLPACPQATDAFGLASMTFAALGLNRFRRRTRDWARSGCEKNDSPSDLAHSLMLTGTAALISGATDEAVLDLTTSADMARDVSDFHTYSYSQGIGVLALRNAGRAAEAQERVDELAEIAARVRQRWVTEYLLWTRINESVFQADNSATLEYSEKLSNHAATRLLVGISSMWGGVSRAFTGEMTHEYLARSLTEGADWLRALMITTGPSAATMALYCAAIMQAQSGPLPRELRKKCARLRPFAKLWAFSNAQDRPILLAACGALDLQAGRHGQAQIDKALDMVQRPGAQWTLGLVRRLLVQCNIPCDISGEST